MRRRTLLLVMLLSVFPWLLSVSAAKATVEVSSALPRSCDHMARQWSSPVEAPLILAQNPTAGSCPDVECEKGTMEGCDADCDPQNRHTAVVPAIATPTATRSAATFVHADEYGDHRRRTLRQENSSEQAKLPYAPSRAGGFEW